MDDKPSPPMENDDEEDPSRQPGFFARIIKFAGGDGAVDDEDVPDIGATAVERALVQNIITMRGQRVEEVMIPRADISAVDATSSLEELTEAFRFGAHSRLPVYRETLDDVIGFVHVKDVALARGVADLHLGDELPILLAVQRVRLGASLDEVPVALPQGVQRARSPTQKPS